MCCSINRLSIISLILFSLICSFSFADDDKPMNKLEFFQKYRHLQTGPAAPTDDPPPQPAIAVAEWEPATGVLICYPLEIPLELVAAMSEVVEVVTFMENEFWMNAAVEDYVRAGVDTANCMFVFTGDENLPYTRDFGPWYIFTGDDEQGFINNEYPWPNQNDGDIPVILGDTLGIPVYDTGLWLEGGNYMTDGLGTAITTDYTYWENEPLTADEIDAIFEEYLGIDRLITTPDPFWNIVPHIDTHAKLLDPGMILVIDDPLGNPILNENVEYWQTLMSGYGRHYEIIRIPGLGYSNSLFLNDHVFVALSGSPGDSVALAIWEEAMPGYEVMGFTHPGFIFLDALHCRTHEAADRYMLRIVHIPIHDCENVGGDFYLEANIHAYSNEPLIGTPYIVWNVDGGAYNYTPMTHISGDDYEGYISQQPDGSDIYYYLEVEDGSDRIENHPYIGPGNPHHFYIGPDNEPPVVEFDPPARVYPLTWPVTLTTYALDNRWISSVTLEYLINGVPQDDVEMPLEEPYAVYYTGTTTGTVQAGDVVEVQVKVVDTSINQNTTYDPPTGYYTIDVIGSPEVLLTLTPYGTPIQIPGGGGSFDFDVLVENQETGAMNFDAWSEVILPDGSSYPLLLREDITLQAGGSILRTLTQNVPPNALSGNYTYKGYVGIYPDTPYNYDSFLFEKLADGDGYGSNDDWSISGWDVEPIASSSAIPTEFNMFPAYPNPFNPNTTLRFDLPEAGKVSLFVYNITGREVATLVDGYRAAGRHEVTFDASNLSSGIYFARLTAGYFHQTQKLLLIK